MGDLDGQTPEQRHAAAEQAAYRRALDAMKNDPDFSREVCTASMMHVADGIDASNRDAATKLDGLSEQQRERALDHMVALANVADASRLFVQEPNSGAVPLAEAMLGWTNLCLNDIADVIDHNSSGSED